MVAGAAFLFASKEGFNLGVFTAMLSGIGLVMGGACVFNNYIDRRIDARMVRTSKRALVSGKVSARLALAYGAVLATTGFGLLAMYTNTYALNAAIVGFGVYVIVYGYFKRRSVHGTAIGSIAGAVPPVVGYSAASGQIDSAAVILFLILVCWQMPHFYSIAIYRLKDYKAAKLPMLPVIIGIKNTKVHIIAYIATFVLACTALTLWNYAGYGYLLVMLVFGLAWLRLAWRGFTAMDNVFWAKNMFKFSLTVLVIFSATISIDGLFL